MLLRGLVVKLCQFKRGEDELEILLSFFCRLSLPIFLHDAYIILKTLIP